MNMDDKILDKYQREAFAMVLVEHDKACDKHPIFPSHAAPGYVIMSEEMLELARAINDCDVLEHQLEEASHVAVTAIRLIAALWRDKEKRNYGN